MRFPRTFTPASLRGHKLPNRIVFGAHTANMSEGGLPGERYIAYCAERARGGAAMIVVEPMPVHPATVLTRGNFRPSDDSVVPPFRKLTAAIKEHGALAIQQLYHVGSHGDSDNSFHPHWSPSGTPSYHDSDASHAMSEAEIEETIDGFVQAARRCREAGFDGVEVWAAYQSITDQFWTPWFNRRTDEWGGSLDNRTRFSREILMRIRKVCGPDFIVGLSVSDEPDFSILLSRDELVEIVAMHDRLGLIDYVTCGSGGYLDFYKLMPTFIYPEKLGTVLSARLKGALIRALVVAESHIRTPENAESVLREGAADLVSIVAVRSPTRISSKRRATAALRTSGSACRATRCAGGADRATIGFLASSIRRPGANSSGAATGSRRRRHRAAFWWSVVGLQVSKPRGSPPNVAIRSSWRRRPTSSAASSGWPECSLAAPRSST